MTDYISIKQILDDVLDHPMMSKVPLERVVNHAVHFIRIVGMPNAFVEKTAIIPIKEYRGCLPCDYYGMIQVRTHHKGHRPGTFRYSTDNFHMSKDKGKGAPMDLTYKLQGNMIYTSIKEGEIEIAYHAMMVDDEGYPMIPDDSAYIRAFELYIKKGVFTTLFELGQINANILQNIQQEYAWAVGQAQSSLIRPSIDQMQSLTNSLNTLVVRATEHDRGFRDNGERELIRLH